MAKNQVPGTPEPNTQAVSSTWKVFPCYGGIPHETSPIHIQTNTHCDSPCYNGAVVTIMHQCSAILQVTR